MKAEETKRYLEYLGCETQCLDRATRPGLRSTKHLPVVTAVLCALILVGMAVYAAHPRGSSVVLAQAGQSVSEEIVVVASPSGTGDSFDTSQASGGAAKWYSGPHFSYECVGPYYWILLGLLAGPGG